MSVPRHGKLAATVSVLGFGLANGMVAAWTRAVGPTPERVAFSTFALGAFAVIWGLGHGYRPLVGLGAAIMGAAIAVYGLVSLVGGALFPW